MKRIVNWLFDSYIRQTVRDELARIKQRKDAIEQRLHRKAVEQLRQDMADMTAKHQDPYPRDPENSTPQPEDEFCHKERPSRQGKVRSLQETVQNHQGHHEAEPASLTSQGFSCEADTQKGS